MFNTFYTASQLSRLAQLPKVLFSLTLTLVFSLTAIAQEPGADIEMADAMRAEGKIYVVVACIVIVLVGLLLYIARLDRQVKQLEQFLDNREGKKA